MDMFLVKLEWISFFRNSFGKMKIGNETTENVSGRRDCVTLLTDGEEMNILSIA